MENKHNPVINTIQDGANYQGQDQKNKPWVTLPDYTAFPNRVGYRFSFAICLHFSVYMALQNRVDFIWNFN